MGVKIGKNCRIYGGNINMWGTEPFLIEIGDNVYITDGCKFVNHDGGTLLLRNKYPDLEVTKKIILGNHIYLGLDTLVLPGVVIEDYVIVGARSVITKKLLSNSVYAGSPAKCIKTLDDYTIKALNDSLKIGHLSADAKEKKLKIMFNV